MPYKKIKMRSKLYNVLLGLNRTCMRIGKERSSPIPKININLNYINYLFYINLNIYYFIYHASKKWDYN